VTAELEALERRGWEALSGPGGAEFYDEIMADDGLMVFPGLVLDKAGAISAIRDAVPWSSFALSDLSVIDAAPDVGLVTYRATAQRAGEEPYGAVMTSVYVRRGGEWRMLLHQQSPATQQG
jgi:hypothetical protein